MKKLIYQSVVLLVSLNCWLSGAKASAQDNQLSIAPLVQSAVVYLDGAELYQKKEITLNAGRTLITFTGISSKVLSKSIQFTASGDANILSVTDKLQKK